MKRPRTEPASALADPIDDAWERAEKRSWTRDKWSPPSYLLTLPNEHADGTPTGFLPQGKSGLLVAPGGTGKTMALMQLAVSVITRRPWLGYYAVPPTHGHVLLALAEEGEEESIDRLQTVCEHLGLGQERELVEERLTLLTLAGENVALGRSKVQGNQRTKVFHTLWKRLSAPSRQWCLVMLDPLARWAGPDAEIDNEAATSFVASLEAFTKAPGRPTVLVAHHSTKEARRTSGRHQGVSAARGAGALTDGVRWVATLWPGSSATSPLELKVVKSNYTRPPAPLSLRRESNGVLVSLTSPPASPQARLDHPPRQDSVPSLPSEMPALSEASPPSDAMSARVHLEDHTPPSGTVSARGRSMSKHKL